MVSKKDMSDYLTECIDTQEYYTFGSQNFRTRCITREHLAWRYKISLLKEHNYVVSEHSVTRNLVTVFFEVHPLSAAT